MRNLEPLMTLIAGQAQWRRALRLCVLARRAAPFSTSIPRLERASSEAKEALNDAAMRIAARSQGPANDESATDSDTSVDLAALDRLRPRAIQQRRTGKISSVGAEMRMRRAQWNKVMRDVSSSFSLQQLIALAKEAKLPGVTNTTSKRVVLPIILEKYFGLKDPSRAEQLGTQQGSQRFLPLASHELFHAAQLHEPMLTRARAAGVKLSLISSNGVQAIMLNGPQSGVEELLVWLSDMKLSISTSIVPAVTTVPPPVARVISHASRCYVWRRGNETVVSHMWPRDKERATMLLCDYIRSIDSPPVHMPVGADSLPFAPPGTLDLFLQARFARTPHVRLVGAENPFELPQTAPMPDWEAKQRADFGHIVFDGGAEAGTVAFIPGVPPAWLDTSGPVSESVRLTYRDSDGQLMEASFDVREPAFKGATWLRRQNQLVPVPNAAIDMCISSEYRRAARDTGTALPEYTEAIGTSGPPAPLAADKRPPVPPVVRVDGVDLLLWRAERVVTRRIPVEDAELVIEDIRRESTPGFARHASVRHLLTAHMGSRDSALTPQYSRGAIWRSG